MIDTTQQFAASMTVPDSHVVHAVQYDTVRRIRLRLYSGATVLQIPYGVTAGVSYTLPNRKNGYFERLTDGTPACIIVGNEVDAAIPPLMTGIAGTVQAAIILRREDEQLSTFPFQIRVAARPGGPLTPDAIPDALSAFTDRLYYGSANGLSIPLEIGPGLEVKNGVLVALAGQDAASKNYVDNAISSLRADMEYAPIEITGISIAPNVAQLGSVVVDPVMRWTLSRMPTAQDIAGEYLDPHQREQVLEESFDGPCHFTLTVTDERGAQATGTVAIAFYNAVYWTSRRNSRGMPADGELHQMSARIQNGRSLTINASAGVGEYVLYAIPSRYGTPKFWCGGLQAAFEKVGTMAHTNEAGYQEDYDVWISEADGLTGVEITVA